LFIFLSPYFLLFSRFGRGQTEVTISCIKLRLSKKALTTTLPKILFVVHFADKFFGKTWIQQTNRPLLLQKVISRKSIEKAIESTFHFPLWLFRVTGPIKPKYLSQDSEL